MRIRHRTALIPLLATVLWTLPVHAAPKIEDVHAADALAAEAPGGARDQALKRWASRAPLGELLYLLRRPPEQLGKAESPLIEAALVRAPKSRVWLRRRLITRLMLVDPGRARSRWSELIHFASELPRHPRASAYRITALLPNSGAYEAYGSAVLAGVEVGLEATADQRELPFELDLRTTGEDDPGQAVAAFDSAVVMSGVMIGPLLSVPTFAVGTGSRYTAIPIVSPTATDESVGAVASTVFQIGPSGFDRGFTLGQAVLGGRSVRVGAIVSDDVEHSPLVRGFAAAANDVGAPLRWRIAYAPGSFSFREEVKTVLAEGIDVLFWDGEAREAEALLRELTRQQATIEICGGEALSPERHHAQTRVLLEGIRYVPDEWVLPPEVAERIQARDQTGAGASLSQRGYLAGRMVGAAVASGSQCPEEITAYLSQRLGDKPYLKSLGFLDVREVGATLPVYTVEQGRSLAR